MWPLEEPLGSAQRQPLWRCRLVGGFVDISKSVRFIDHHEVPGNLANVSIFGACELERANDNFVAHKRIEVHLLDLFVEGFCLKDDGWQKELV